MGKRGINQMINYTFELLLHTEIISMKKGDKELWKPIIGEPDIVWSFKEGFLRQWTWIKKRSNKSLLSKGKVKACLKSGNSTCKSLDIGGNMDDPKN